MSTASKPPVTRATPVREIMSHQVISLQIEERASVADTLMKHHAIHHLPVLEGKVLRGIVTQTDLYKNMLSYFLVESDREQQEFLDEVLDLSALMTMEPVSLEPEQTVGDALELMLRFRIGSIPVVNSMNELIGIVTDYDLLKLLDAKLK